MCTTLARTISSTTLRRMILSAALLLTAPLFQSCRTIKVPEYMVTASEDAETADDSGAVIRIAQISDFHSNDFGKNEQELLNKLTQAGPDLVMLTGDIFDFEMNGEKPIENVRLLVTGIPCPFFYVSGNHEFFKYHRDEWSHVISENGGVILDNDAVLVETEKAAVIIAGVSDPYRYATAVQKKKDKPDTAAYFAQLAEVSRKVRTLRQAWLTATPVHEQSDLPRAVCTILLAHRSEYIEEYLKYDYDLILSGHAHGGQWRIPGLFNGLYAPGQGLFPRYAGGRYDFDRELTDGDTADGKKRHHTVFIVSRGLSRQHPVLVPRIFNNPELVIVDLKVPAAADSK